MQSKYLKCHLLILAVIFSGSSVSAQQLLKVSNYMDHNFINNPAAVGAHGNATFGASKGDQRRRSYLAIPIFQK
jgi:hypothetical protein